jgi:hypothetical protein
MNIKEINNAISSLEVQFADAVNGIVEQTLVENFKDQLRTAKSKKNIVIAGEINDKIESLVKERKIVLAKLNPGLLEIDFDLKEENEVLRKQVESLSERNKILEGEQKSPQEPELKPENYDSE